MINPKTADIGRRVRYEGLLPKHISYGLVQSFTDEHVVVRFYGKAGTHPVKRENLRWTNPKPDDA